MVANLHAKKDHATLVAAWRRVVDRFDGLDQAPHLLLAGVLGDQYDALVRQVATLSLEGHVHFLGEVGNVGDLLRTVDLAVFSSHAEGIPNAVLEAMAHELAVVATDYPGIREAVGPEGRSLLARPCDSEGLADKILMAAADSPLRERLGQQGRRRVVKLFSVDRMGSDMASIIRSEWRRVSS
jgi:glycosyltransferase involved in cell wall biosynthesis